MDNEKDNSFVQELKKKFAKHGIYVSNISHI